MKKNNDKMTVAIVGSGITGLVAAYELLKKGVRVCLFEKENFLGGMASCTKVGDAYIEKLYHHIFNSDTELVSLLDELGLAKKLVWKKSTVGVYYQEDIYPFSTPKDMISFPPFDWLSKIKFALTSAYLKFKPSKGALVKEKAYIWLKRHFGDRVYKIIWEPLLRGKFQGYYKKVSMAWMWARIHKRSNSRLKFGSDEKLGYLLGGLESLISILEKKIRKMGGKIFLETEIKKILHDPSKGKIKLSYKGKEQFFDKVVCTTSCDVFYRLIKENKIGGGYLRRLKKIKYIGALCALFSSSQDLSDFYWVNICDVKTPFSVFIQHTNLINKRHYGNRYLYYIGAYLEHSDKMFKLPDSKIIKIYTKSLEKIFPDFDVLKAADFSVFKFSDAQHIVDDSCLRKKIDNKTAISNVWLFNSSQSPVVERTVNKAVSSGRKIAETII